MAIDTNKVQQQAAELSNQIWSICNDLRGGMDANEFRNYILGTIFYRYLSERTEMYMQDLLKEMEAQYDLVLFDAPPINIVSDPLALSSAAVGSLFVVRQNFSDHREIRKALVTAEMTGMNILGFVFYGENLKQGSYYSRRHYQNYYHAYDKSRQPDGDPE